MNDRYHLFWTIDYDLKEIKFEVRATLENKFDWFALGLSDYGDIKKSDLCFLWSDHQGRFHFQVKSFIS